MPKCNRLRRHRLRLDELESRTNPAIYHDGSTIWVTDQGASIYRAYDTNLSKWYYTPDGGLGGSRIYLEGQSSGAFADDSISAINMSGSGADELFSVAENITIPVTIDGKGGTDTVRYSADMDLTVSNSSLQGNTTFVLSSIERAELIGGDSDNVLVASSFTGTVSLDGRGGNDQLFGGLGGNGLSGGDGNDVLHAETGLAAGLGGGAGVDRLYGSAFDDIIDGGAGDGYIEGGDGNDLISGGDANDTIYGGDGTDTIAGNGGNDYIDAGDGGHATGVFQQLFGNDGNDQLIGGSGQDYFDPGEGTDVVDGVGQLPDPSYPELPDRLRQDVLFVDQTAPGEVVATATTVVGPGINVTFSNVGKVNVSGTTGNDVLRMTGPHHYSMFLSGDDGTDRLEFQAGSEVKIIGGFTPLLHSHPGKPYYYYSLGVTGATLVEERQVHVTGSGNTRFDLSNFYNPQQQITLEGQSGGNDRLYFRVNEGNATVTDSKITFSRSDTATADYMNLHSVEIDGGDTNNKFDASAYTGRTTLRGGGGQDTLLGGTGNDRLEGQDGADSLNGGAGNDILEGGNGKDVLDGGAGTDSLKGGADDDTIDAGNDAVPDHLYEDGDVNFDLSKIRLRGMGSDLLRNFANEQDKASLYGGPSANTFTIGDWKAEVSVDGSAQSGGAADVFASTGDLDYSYDGVDLKRTSGGKAWGKVTLTDIEGLKLVGGGAANRFEFTPTTPAGFTSVAIEIDGKGGKDTLAWTGVDTTEEKLTLQADKSGVGTLKADSISLLLKLKGIEIADLKGRSNADDTFDLSGWRKEAFIRGFGADESGIDTIDADAATDVTVSVDTSGNTIIQRKDGGKYTLSGLNQRTFISSQSPSSAQNYSVRDRAGTAETGNLYLGDVSDKLKYSIDGATSPQEFYFGNDVASGVHSSARPHGVVGTQALVTIQGTAQDDTFNLRWNNSVLRKATFLGQGGKNTLKMSVNDMVPAVTLGDKSVLFGDYNVTLSKFQSAEVQLEADAATVLDVGEWSNDGKIAGAGDYALHATDVGSWLLDDSFLLTPSGALWELGTVPTSVRLTNTGGGGSFDITGWTLAGLHLVGSGSTALKMFGLSGQITLANSSLTVAPSGLSVTFSGIGKAQLGGSATADTFDASAFTGPTTMSGGAGNDTLIGGSAVDTLFGEGDNDTLDGRGSKDILDGGPGTDTAINATGDVKKNIP
jgi:Ca2+-binding RTX toxin-like protein